ncbi:RNA methyltransferase [Dysgonomonas sp. Marseille-P4677]|uniref:RNA methyltransferase n=1 Tax=Dysgonomonas sp. Marseille-P4677 TaxID=2364790 RepID=UPI001912A185|nr:RNA methyltransferase [Dysgonomonas sp. Marseille-P4677]MBK5720314.1 RNA methyltransferase [Dysgonomonas sp. Marseille-P4677]
MSLSKNKLKYIRSLKEKKFRSEYGTFVAEGNKLIRDLLPYIKCQLLVATSTFLSDADVSDVEEVIEVNDAQLAQASFLQSPQQALAVFYQVVNKDDIDFSKELLLALDGVQDPGNLGTIIRLADWYGIKHVFCSYDTADVYNPKVVQATMGALARVSIHYLDLANFLFEHKDIPVYGTLLNGQNMYEQTLSSNGIIIMGNEGNGIRPEIEQLITNKLYIPNYPVGNVTSESLNVAIATAIVCAEFRRRSF